MSQKSTCKLRVLIAYISGKYMYMQLFIKSYNVHVQVAELGDLRACEKKKNVYGRAVWECIKYEKLTSYTVP